MNTAQTMGIKQKGHQLGAAPQKGGLGGDDGKELKRPGRRERERKT